VKRLLGFLRSHIRALGVVGFAIYAAALLVVARYLSLPAWLAVGLALAGPGAAYGLAVLRRQFLPAAVSEVKDDVVIELNNWKAEVSDVLFRSTLTKDPPDAERVGAELLARLDALIADANTATTTEQLDAIRLRARWVASTRAYIVPAAAIPVEAQDRVDELSSWRLPDEVTKSAAARLQQLQSIDAKDDLRRRFMLELIYDDYDYWDWYSDWYVSTSLYPTLWALVTLFGAFFTLALLAFFYGHHVVLGVLAAGASGAALSILPKLPPMSVYGEAVGAAARMVARFVAGVAATAMGFGLLATGFVNIGVPVGAGQQSATQFIGVPGLVQVCADERSSPDGQSPSAASEALKTGPHAACTTAGLMLLLAIGIAFGFSERALASFESLIIAPSSNNGGSPARNAGTRGGGTSNGGRVPGGGSGPAKSNATTPASDAPATEQDTGEASQAAYE